ncbi:phosphatidylethanolamine-binding protein (PEBP) family uncharacterized protein [Agrobacterium tumefaciens]|nr:phosphatidylethanolamine-binding protein (PEBP) family uncharacterized protein [Agrobacterium tumefaciens]
MVTTAPARPINDQRVHRYILEVVALDVVTLGLSGPFTGEDVEKAMAGHILASGKATATYSLNPSLIPAATAK